MAGTGKTVMITGANGFLGSHIVRQLLSKGYNVNACVRDCKNKQSVNHLLNLSGSEERLKLFSTGDLQSAKGSKCFDEPMNGCEAVIHSATPLPMNVRGDDGEKQIFEPAISSTEELLDCIGRNCDTVKTLVLTSSMAAIAPRPEPPIKDESCWSDPEEQKARGSWYGATKTAQEQITTRWVEEEKTLSSEFRFVAICPTCILGPSLRTSTEITGTMGRLLDWCKGSFSEAPNDSMSFIHVEDCAAMHVAALESPNARGRYMSLVESLHWNDILTLMKEIRPKVPEFKLYENDDKVEPTKNNLERMRTLGVDVKSTREIMEESMQYLQSVGALD